jgi:hypothetical protein
MQQTCKATIAYGDSKITFEGPPDFVQAQVEKFANMRPTGPSTNDVAVPPESILLGSKEKQLINEKRPRGHHEIATVLAFVLRETGMTEFSEDDIRRAYIRADVRPPKYVSQALRDAKSKFDYIATGTKRGTYKLTNHGDRTVRFDLPRATG